MKEVEQHEHGQRVGIAFGQSVKEAPIGQAVGESREHFRGAEEFDIARQCCGHVIDAG